MSDQQQEINALLVPLRGQFLLVPQATVAELTGSQLVSEVPKTPPWFKGVVEWRAEQIPVLCLEALCGDNRALEMPAQRLAIFYGIDGYAGLPFYAVEIAGIPHPMKINQGSLEADTEANSEACNYVSTYVRMGTQQHGLIANLSEIERTLSTVMERL
ncbi:MAG: chemotaxis protein CheW [Gammaproteobacteria bacterium]|jgi:chemosensory pili system protein ChpC